MERLNIIKEFISSGYQLSNDALDFLIKNPEKGEEFLKRATHQTTPTVINSNFLISFLNTESVVELKLTPDDYMNIFTKRFDTIKNIFSQKPDSINLISINKISPRIKKFSIIGMVKEIDYEDKTLLLEDRTGETTIQLEDSYILKEIVEDEVLNVVCENTDIGFIGKNILFPDIPIRREINKTKDDNYCLFISDFHMDSNLFKRTSYSKYVDWLENQKEKITIFIVGDISSAVKDVEKILSDTPKKHVVHIIKGETDPVLEKNILPSPSSFQIENVNIFLLHNQNINYYINLWTSPEKTLINLLKKRHLDPVFTPEKAFYKKDPYLLESTPDIIVAGHTHTPSNTNYKGTTILTTGSFVSQPIFWLINLRTREIFKEDFS